MFLSFFPRSFLDAFLHVPYSIILACYHLISILCLFIHVYLHLLVTTDLSFFLFSFFFRSFHRSFFSVLYSFILSILMNGSNLRSKSLFSTILDPYAIPALSSQVKCIWLSYLEYHFDIRVHAL